MLRGRKANRVCGHGLSDEGWKGWRGIILIDGLAVGIGVRLPGIIAVIVLRVNLHIVFAIIVDVERGRVV